MPGTATLRSWSVLMSLMRRRQSGKDQRPVGPAGAKVLGWESAVVPGPERKLAGISSRAWVWMEWSHGPDHGEPCRPCTEFEFIRATVGSLWRAPDKGNLAHFASFSQRWQYPVWLYRAYPKQRLSAAATGAVKVSYLSLKAPSPASSGRPAHLQWPQLMLLQLFILLL